MLKIRKHLLSLVCLLFLSLLFPLCLVAQEKGLFSLNDKFKISGDFVGGYRASLTGHQSALPYQMSYYAKFYLVGIINPNLNLKLTLFARNNTMCGSFYEYAMLSYRFFGEYQSEIKNSFQWKIGFGDLGRVKLGQGLTLDQIELEGTKIQFFFKDFWVRLFALPAGLTRWEDIGALQISDLRERFGVVYVDTIFQEPYPFERQLLASIYGKVSFLKYFTLYAEFAGAKNIVLTAPKTKDSAFLAGLFFRHENAKVKIQVSGEYRRYGGDFNIPYVGHLGELYLAYDTEDKKINNWRSYLWFSGDLSGGSLQASLEGKIYKKLRWLTEVEHLDIVATVTTKTFNFYKAGLVLGLIPKVLDFYFVVTNKSINNPWYRWTELAYQDFMFTEHKHFLIQAKAKFQ